MDITDQSAHSHKTVFLKDYQQPHFWINKINLNVSLYTEYTRVISKLEFSRNQHYSKVESLVLHGEALKLVALKLNQIPLTELDYQLSEDKNTLTIFKLPDFGTLEIETEIYPDKNTELSGLYWVNGLYCTQCESEGFRRITYYLDRPDVMAIFETRIEADKSKYPVLLSNGNCIEIGSVGTERHFAIWQDPYKKPCYLFALVAGDLVSITDHYLTRSQRLVTLKIFVERNNQDKCQHAMQALKKAMQWDEETYHREYDLDIYMIVAVNDFNSGAMENKGLNIFNSKYILARPESATDRDYQLIDAVVGHEYFHNWSGNRITCRDWFQLSLKEGLTVFREHQFNADMTKSPVSLIENVRLLKSAQFTEDSGPLAHPVQPDSYVEISNFYTTTVYEKGAELIRMLKILIGSDAFYRGMDLYFKEYDGQAVTIDEFVSAMSKASSMDLSQFKLWYKQAGTPELTIAESFDIEKNFYRLTITQFSPPTPLQTTKLPMHIPFAIGLLDPETGVDLLPEVTRVLQLKERTEIFEFANLVSSNNTVLKQKPVLSALRNFSAPVKLKTELSDEALAFLLKHDSDDFTRWDAGQQLVERLIIQHYNASLVSNALPSQKTDLEILWIDAMNSVLKDLTIHPALKAEMLSFPSLSYLIDLENSVEIDVLYHSLNYVKKAFVSACDSVLLEIYEKNLIAEAYAYTPEQTGKRSLKNTMLRYLASADVPERGIELCMQQWHHADNMTDSFAVLTALADVECKERTQLLKAFYTRWQHDPNVLDKWFRVQATSELPNVLDIVKSLTQHPDFSLKNPNKVYSLLNAFAVSNVAFHTASGEGYQFLADKIIELNTLNPQVAARLLKSLSNWKKFDLDRQEKIRTQLLRIKHVQGVSKDVFEVADKTLG